MVSKVLPFSRLTVAVRENAGNNSPTPSIYGTPFSDLLAYRFSIIPRRKQAARCCEAQRFLGTVDSLTRDPPALEVSVAKRKTSSLQQSRSGVRNRLCAFGKRA